MGIGRRAASAAGSDGEAMANGERQWRFVTAALGLLLAAIAVVGVVAIISNERVNGITAEAIASDLEIEDEGDDLRAAVLDLRHYHRNIVFGGPSERARAQHTAAYMALLEEIDELAAVGIERLAARGIAQPQELRGIADAYIAGFRPAIDLPPNEAAAFTLASNEGLDRLRELESAAEEVDEIGEVLAAESLDRIELATATERLLLYAVLGGVALAGIALAVGTGRVVARLHASYDREQNAVRELARTLRTKNDFIADASHELRTPLTVIRGNADIGLATPGEPLHREILEEISNEGARMSRLVDDLLFLARTDAGAAPLEREVVSARRLIDQIAKPAERLVEQHGARLATTNAADGLLDVDPSRIEQAVLILVDNAGKHSPPGGQVTLSSSSRHGLVIIAVADEGPGIPAAELPMIFDRFYQVGERRTRKKGGAGLGLSIAKSIVEAHGGGIGVSSSEQGGTRMTIQLPLCPVAATAAEPAPRPVRPSQPLASR